MLGAIATTLLFPRIGLPIQAMLLLWAIVADQSRIQPHVLSLFYLGCGTVPGSWGGLVIARASLVALWFFSGIHKLSSPDFFAGTVPWLMSSLGLPKDGIPTVACGLGLGAVEVALGAGSLIPATRTDRSPG